MCLADSIGPVAGIGVACFCGYDSVLLLLHCMHAHTR